MDRAGDRADDVADEAPPPLPVPRLVIDTQVPPYILRDELRMWEPWRYAIDFSNGVTTADLERGPFFVEEPLEKFWLFGKYLPPDLHGATALDVGCNIGHNAFHLRQHYGMTVTGVDNSPRNIALAQFLADVGTIDGVEFLCRDANELRLDRSFDLVLHLTTLLFLPDPFRALRNTVSMLAPGGCLILEAETYRDPDGHRTLCQFHPHTDPNDGEPWWSLGPAAVECMLRSAGCSDVAQVFEWKFEERLYRTVFVAHRSTETSAATPSG